MSALQVQQALRGGVGLQGLLSQFGIKSRRHVKHPNLVCLKYDQINSPMGGRARGGERGRPMSSGRDDLAGVPIDAKARPVWSHCGSGSYSEVEVSIDGKVVIAGLELPSAQADELVERLLAPKHVRLAGEACVDWGYDTGGCHLCGCGEIVGRYSEDPEPIRAERHDDDCPLAVLNPEPPK